MEWSQQFKIFEKIISQRLSELGKKLTDGNAAELLGVKVHKYKAWREGQRPVVEDMRMLAQEFEFKPDWLLLGIGEPIQPRLGHPFDAKYVEICDTLHELIRALPDRLPKIAEIGGISTTDLYNCIHTQAFPPSQAVAKWIVHYRINANFLLAQIGQPFLTESEFQQQGPLDRVRSARGDFLNLDDDDQDEASQSKVVELQEHIKELKYTVELQKKMLQQVQVSSPFTQPEPFTQTGVPHVVTDSPVLGVHTSTAHKTK